MEIGVEQPINTDTITLQSNIKPVVCSITSDSNKV